MPWPPWFEGVHLQGYCYLEQSPSAPLPTVVEASTAALDVPSTAFASIACASIGFDAFEHSG